MHTTYAVNQDVTHVYFGLDDVFTIRLHTLQQEMQVRIQASSEGEYANHFVIY